MRRYDIRWHTLFTKVNLPSGPCESSLIQVQVLLSALKNSLGIIVPWLLLFLLFQTVRPNSYSPRHNLFNLTDNQERIKSGSKIFILREKREYSKVLCVLYSERSVLSCFRSQRRDGMYLKDPGKKRYTTPCSNGV